MRRTTSSGSERRRRGIGAALAAAGIALGVVAVTGAQPPATAGAAYLAAFPDFAPIIAPQLPGDVDIALKTRLEGAQRFAEVQREFDLYSWQMFLALNWPTDAAGAPASSLTAAGGAPAWTLWHNSASIFQTDGARPDACATRGPRPLAAARNLAKPVSKGLRAFSAAAVSGADPRRTRFLGVMSAVGELNAANLSEITQAFSGPLIDQNGEFVFYEIMVDPNETRYLCDNALYNINGQVAFARTHDRVVMPSGSNTADASGSFELKFAWRILKQGSDDFSRFFATPAVVMDPGPDGKPVERRVTVGLVGMHIGHKTLSSPQWIWSTFEHVDNLDVDPVANPKLKPSFTDPDCAICAVNQPPVADKNGVYPRIPTQASRAVPIPADKARLNAQAQAVLRKLGSVWQHYQLVDTQWPTRPNAKPSPWNGGLPQAVTNKSGGHPTPVMLTNITMETYFQGGNQTACKGEELPNDVSCPSGPAVPAVWNGRLNGGKAPVKPGINTTAFMTESCTGCHSSAGVWKSYDPATGKGTQLGQLSGDFSWLLAQKASWTGPAQ